MKIYKLQLLFTVLFIQMGFITILQTRCNIMDILLCDNEVNGMEKVINIRYSSTGKNSMMLRNIPPDSRESIYENDVAILGAGSNRKQDWKILN